MPDRFQRRRHYSHSRRRATLHRLMGSNAPSAGSNDAVCGCLLWLSAVGAREHSQVPVVCPGALLSKPIGCSWESHAHKPGDCSPAHVCGVKIELGVGGHLRDLSRGVLPSSLVRPGPGLHTPAGARSRRSHPADPSDSQTMNMGRPAEDDLFFDT